MENILIEHIREEATNLGMKVKGHTKQRKSKVWFDYDCLNCKKW